jgi:hypothetical protein
MRSTEKPAERILGKAEASAVHLSETAVAVKACPDYCRFWDLVII